MTKDTANKGKPGAFAAAKGNLEKEGALCVEDQKKTQLFEQTPIPSAVMKLAVPTILSSLVMVIYNLADTYFVGMLNDSVENAAVTLAAPVLLAFNAVNNLFGVGSSSMMSRALGRKDYEVVSKSSAFGFYCSVISGILFSVLFTVFSDPFLVLLGASPETAGATAAYLKWTVTFGATPAILNVVMAYLVRSEGSAMHASIGTMSGCLMNIVLDLWFVLGFHWGVAGAAFATVLSQYVSGIGLAVYTYWKTPEFRIQPRYLKPKPAMLKEIGQFSFLTSVQQSVMNLGILMVQGLVNSFGTVIMAGFAAAVKIDSFAYMPAQEFGNAFSTFVAQNYGAGKSGRIREGIKKAVLMSVGFCLVISLLVFIFARPLMTIFVDPSETEILAAGVEYLRIEGAFYCGIGCLFLLYGLYRAIKRPGMSVVLTIFSLGTRVVLAYALSAIDFIGVTGIWWSVPIGWALADLVGFLYYKKNKKKLFN